MSQETTTRLPAAEPESAGGSISRLPEPTGTRVGLFRPIGAGQVVLWEMAVLAVIATAYLSQPAAIAVVSAAPAAMLMTSVRLDGLCFYQWLGTLARYRSRRRSGGRPAVDPLAAALPELRLHRQVDPAGNRAGVAQLADGWTAVVRLTPTAKPDPAVLLDLLRDAHDRPDLPLSSAQLVVWSVPGAPRPRYRGDRGEFEPARVHWLAVRYRPANAPHAALARGGGDTGAAKAATAAARALASRLGQAGYHAVVLDEPELRQELLVALGCDPAALGRSDARVRETWRDWSVGALSQLGYQPADERVGRTLLGRRLPQAAFTCVSYTLARTVRGTVQSRTRVRVGMHPTQRRPTVRQVSRALHTLLLSGNGRQQRYLLETLPLALGDH